MAGGASALEAFVKESLQRGQDRGEIARVLMAAGWPNAQIAAALAAYADLAFPVPVPRPQASLSARDTFLYLLLFLTLALASWSLGNLLCSFINRALPDAAMRAMFVDRDEQRWSTAVIVVDTPVFFCLSWLLNRDLLRNPYKRLSPVRRWLTYLALFVTAFILLGDLAYMIWDALRGEPVLRTALKLLVVGAIAGSIFAYYFIDMRQDEQA